MHKQKSCEMQAWIQIIFTLKHYDKTCQSANPAKTLPRPAIKLVYAAVWSPTRDRIGGACSSERARWTT